MYIFAGDAVRKWCRLYKARLLSDEWLPLSIHSSGPSAKLLEERMLLQRELVLMSLCSLDTAKANLVERQCLATVFRHPGRQDAEWQQPGFASGLVLLWGTQWCKAWPWGKCIAHIGQQICWASHEPAQVEASCRTPAPAPGAANKAFQHSDSAQWLPNVNVAWMQLSVGNAIMNLQVHLGLLLFRPIIEYHLGIENSQDVKSSFMQVLCISMVRFLTC